MRAILIDDEKPALTHLSRLINADGRITIAGTYLSARSGLEHLAKDKVDVVFLDIGMPEINGLEAAQLIKQLDMNIQIVYITAYSDYAIEAFELYVLDYILKPVDAARFSKTLDRIFNNAPERAAPRKQGSDVKISMFRRLELIEPVQEIGKFKWRTLKSQELFAFLLHYKGEWISKQQLVETIWSEYEHNKALTHLHTSIYQTRKILKELGGENMVEFALDSYRLLGERITTDAELYEREFNEIKPIDEQLWAHYDSLLALYKGDYLAEHDYGWTAKRSNQLEHYYLTAIMAVARYELGSSRERQALTRLAAAQDKEPYSEEICALIMQAYASLEEYTALEQYYKSFERQMRAELGVEPEHSTQSLYRELMTK